MLLDRNMHNEDGDLEPKVDIYLKKESIDSPVKKQKKSFVLKFFSILTVLIVLLGASGFAAYNGGFLPAKKFSPIYKPIGNSVEIELKDYIEDIPQIKEIYEYKPYLDKIKYKLYGTNANCDYILSNYKERLQNKGYALKYTGAKNIKGVSIEYLGFVKGITAVGIVTTSDLDEISEHNSLVLYTTGNVFAYKDLYDLANNKKGYQHLL